MKKMFILPVLLIGIMLALTAAYAFGAGSKQDTEAKKEDKKTETAGTTGTTETKELTKEQIVERLNHIFQYRLDIREGVPGIVVDETGQGVVVEYNGTQLEQLDKDTLSGLSGTVNEQISLKNLKNIENLQKTQQQLRNLREIDNINRTQQMLRRQRAVSPNIPKVYTPPKIPKTYNAPKTYKAPK
ncbi:MAG: hypothetical protein KJ995_07155 [Candidatus Omnitrophica bacterium]|nr:hypothetical protein [Candidatus Omnitrophota bacterium]MBU1128626.1 hypothetical protein [Candidatus Omnitrophota bacterium]MBU1656765.1 hypothetical protein [Candidatus Omnitrophota bacterium]MBU1784674.1 hypothetical protein [Candidatus Omnitrophota bacterium]MBU1852161.1 hypothetical protein [Candidatus Omnitrophota bacterium]